MKSTTLLRGWLREDWIEIENVSLHWGARTFHIVHLEYLFLVKFIYSLVERKS